MSNLRLIEAFRIYKDEGLPSPDLGLRMWNGLDFQPAPEDNFDMGFGQPDWVLKVHNAYSGRCFIFGTGPSLVSQLPLLGHMKGEMTFTVNRMAKWKDLPFTPTHHCIAEPAPIGNGGRFVHPQYDHPQAINRIAINWSPVVAPGWLWVAKAHDDVQMRWHGFFGLGDTLPPVPTGWCSPLTVCQVAAWMGFQEFYFLGIDTTQEGQAWDQTNGRTQQPRAVVAILECADRAYHQIIKAGRKIYDCTPGGRINLEGVLPFMPLEDVLGIKVSP